MSTEAATPNPGPVDPVGSDLARILRALKLSGLKDTLPERLVTARTNKLGHAAFLELLLSDELAAVNPAPPHCGQPAPDWIPRCGWRPGTTPGT